MRIDSNDKISHHGIRFLKFNSQHCWSYWANFCAFKANEASGRKYGTFSAM